MRAIKRSIADARDERDRSAIRDADRAWRRVVRHTPPLRCEPCPRVVPARTLLDGSIVQHFLCDGWCVAPGHRAAARSMTTARVQAAIIAVLAVIAAGWIALAASEAAADGTRGRTAERDDARRERRVAERPAPRGDDHDGTVVGAASPPVLEAPAMASVHGPPIDEVLAAAYRTAGLDGDLGRGFVRRSRLAGLVPWLSVRTGRDTSWRDDTTDVARGVTIEVRATWRLDRLVFDGRELQVAALDAARRRERRRLAGRVIQVYFSWKRAMRSGTRGAAGRAEEAAAELDDLTNGWFSGERASLRGTSDPRTLDATP